MNASEALAVVRAGGIAIALSADSRGYVMTTVLIQENEQLVPLVGTITCEYLPDLFNATALSMKWMIENCEDIKHEKRHLYWKFKGV